MNLAAIGTRMAWHLSVVRHSLRVAPQFSPQSRCGNDKGPFPVSASNTRQQRKRDTSTI
ncbi:unnamed protein product [Ectocarpus sp. CCAP 1310/34]|nr:unnamed protein product [Ectocarpus sp. CCAP 1310/34]